MSRLTKHEANKILRRLALSDMPDFHSLNSAEVESIIGQADLRRYRAPKNAKGSRARCFYCYVTGVARGEWSRP